MVEQRQQREVPPGFHNQKEGWVQTPPAPDVTGAGDQGPAGGACGQGSDSRDHVSPCEWKQGLWAPGDVTVSLRPGCTSPPSPRG